MTSPQHPPDSQTASMDATLQEGLPAGSDSAARDTSAFGVLLGFPIDREDGRMDLIHVNGRCA